MSKIEWTGLTWNPTIGCTEITPGCRNCYAAKMAYRLMHIPAMKDTYAGIAKRLDNGKIVFTGLVKELPERLREPMLIKKPTTFFVDSMSDLFHNTVTWNYIYKVFEVMLLTPQHTYQVLTKRANRLPDAIKDVYFHLERNYPGSVFPLPNVQIGVSAENQDQFDKRYKYLSHTPAAVRFVSIEPQLGAVDLAETFGLYEYDDKAWSLKLGERWAGSPDWIIAGGESGTGKDIRPVHPDWIRQLQQQCAAAGVPFFFKQWGNWLPFYDRDIDDPDWRKVPAEKAGKIRFMNLDGEWGFHGKRVVYFNNVGKAAAGAVLDGKEYRELPNTKVNE